uniref:Pentatricopeptide repeat protein n=1 Tax=Salvia miltiorrhiza TaxID=226208 RepID=A0A678WE03_SALMI|nr:pentatricopeptide repeat protein [Salvia miltiorrhiza]
MNWRCFFSKNTVNKISKLNGRAFNQQSSAYRCFAAASISSPPIPHPLGPHHGSSFSNCPKHNKSDNRFCRWIQTWGQVKLDDDSSSHLECESEDDATMNEFLSRFVWLMRKKLTAAYPECDKDTINGMLVIIVENVVSEMEKGGLQQVTGRGASVPPQDFSEDLWRTVWDISNIVLQDMEKEKKKEKMKTFLQSEDVKEMYRFAGEVGIRGDMLRELRFKWARQKMEKSDFYESLERMRKGEAQNDSQEKDQWGEEDVAGKELVADDNLLEGKQTSFSLPKRHGKIKYTIYGLDLSNPKWAKVADKIHESSKVMWPEEPKPISNKCKLVTEKILSLKDEDDPAPLLGEWKDLLQPSRIDWVALLDRLKEQNSHLYFKVAEYLLSEDSFQASDRDYSKLIDALAKENRLEDVERILKNMNDRGILPDVITSIILIKMYCKAGNLSRAKEAFDSCKAHGFQPDVKLYSSMIMAYLKANQPKDGESLMREMETRGIKPPKEMFMALLQLYTKVGRANEAERIFSALQFTGGYSLDLESLTLIVEAFAKAGNPQRAMTYFDQILSLRHKPDDRCTANVIAAYQKRDLLDQAIGLLLRLEEEGFEPGVATYTVLVEWFSKLDLLEEAEQLLDKIAELGETPPFKLHVSLCDMCIKSGAEKKALQALGVLESKLDELESEDFERIIKSLCDGGYVQDAERVHGLMKSRGFVLSERVSVNLLSSKSMGKNKKTLTREK